MVALSLESSADMTDLASAAVLFKAMADPIRLKLVALVRSAPDQEACFCDLRDHFDVPQSSLSHHLKILVQAGVLSRERRGTWSWYSLRPNSMDVMVQTLRPNGPLQLVTDNCGDECGTDISRCS